MSKNCATAIPATTILGGSAAPSGGAQAEAPAGSKPAGGLKGGTIALVCALALMCGAAGGIFGSLIVAASGLGGGSAQSQQVGSGGQGMQAPGGQGMQAPGGQGADGSDGQGADSQSGTSAAGGQGGDAASGGAGDGAAPQAQPDAQGSSSAATASDAAPSPSGTAEA